MAWDEYERLLRLERLELDLEQGIIQAGLELIYLRQKIEEAWLDTSAANVPPTPTGTLGVTTFGCNGELLPGVDVTYDDGTTTYGPATSDSLGVATLTALPAGSGTVTASHSAWSTTVSKPATVGVATTISMASATPQPGTHCSCGCPLPIADSFTYTSGNGLSIPSGTAVTMNYRAAFGDWAGSANGTYSGIDAANCAGINFANPPLVPINGPVVVTLNCSQPFSGGPSIFAIGEGVGHCVTGFGQVEPSNAQAVDMTQIGGFSGTVFAKGTSFFQGTCAPLSMTGKDALGTPNSSTITP